MSDEKRRKRELLEIVLAAASSDATDEQIVRASQLIVEDPLLAQYAVELLSQEAWLNWHGSQVQTSKLLDQLTSASPIKSSRPLNGASLPNQRDVADCACEQMFTSPNQFEHLRSPVLERITRPRFTAFVLAATLLGVGALLGALAATWSRLPQLAKASPDSAYSARFVQGTACIWGPGMQTPGVENGKLRSGESLNLIEGLAEIELDLATGGNATVQIEGPARMVLTAEGTPSLTQGKFCTDVQPGFGDFLLETPLGQVTAVTDSSLGIAVYGLEVEVHVFHGEVVVASPWTAEENSVGRFTLNAGQSLRLSAADSQAVTVAQGAAEPARFASQTSMGTDRLDISPDYVKEVVKAQPIVYWRFESLDDGAIPNEVGDEFRGIVFGSTSWAQQGDNRAIEFGAGLAGDVFHARVESSDAFGNQIADSYSIEAWVKPSHYHLGTLSSLVRNPEDTKQPAAHGALLELGGPLTTPSTIEHPGRVRFLHRDPPSGEPLAGTSCFSQAPYNLRRWEHVVAVKDGGEMRLYIDGELVAKANDNTKLAPNLTLLVGQLDRHRDWRRFVGQLDELAVYNRALSDGEIRTHFRLVRPRQKSSPSSI